MNRYIHKFSLQLELIQVQKQNPLWIFGTNGVITFVFCPQKNHNLRPQEKHLSELPPPGRPFPALKRCMSLSEKFEGGEENAIVDIYQPTTFLFRAYNLFLGLKIVRGRIPRPPLFQSSLNTLFVFFDDLRDPSPLPTQEIRPSLGTQNLEKWRF